MKCFECGHPIEIEKKRIVKYDGVSLDNVYLFNAEVEVCSNCNEETPILRNISKLHNAIGLAVAAQPSRLSGADIKLLRRIAGFSLLDWTKRLGVAETAYSKLENSKVPLTELKDRWIRVHFLDAIKQTDLENVHISNYLNIVLSANISQPKDFAVAIDVDNLEARARYLPLDSPLLIKPKMSVVEAKPLVNEPPATAQINGERPNWALASTFNNHLIGETKNVGDALALAA